MQGYIKLRRGIVEHLRDRRISSDEYTAYTTIILLADHHSGFWKGSAPALAEVLNWSIRFAQPVLKSLIAKGYLSRVGTNKRGNYLLKIVKYFKPHDRQTVPVKTSTRPANRAGQKPHDRQTVPVKPVSDRQTVPTYQEEVLNQQEEHIQEGAKLAPPRELPGFALFWAAYPISPNKRDQEGALKQWLSKVRIDADWLPVLEGLERWKVSGRWDDSQYIPNPAKFLYRKQWLTNPPANGGSHVITPRQQKSKATSTALNRVFGGSEVRDGVYGGDDGSGTNRIADHGVSGGSDGDDNRANPRGIQEGKKDITLFPKACGSTGVGARGN